MLTFIKLERNIWKGGVREVVGASFLVLCVLLLCSVEEIASSHIDVTVH
jgi:hypothetical protein